MELQKKIARLESAMDHMSTELQYVDDLLKVIGFEEGLVTLKYAAEELASCDCDGSV